MHNVLFFISQEAKFLYSDDTIKYKLIELTGLAMYWDDYVEEIGKLPAKKIRVSTS